MVSGALCSGGGSEAFLADLPELDDLELLLEKNAGWTKDVRASEPELEKEWVLLKKGLPSFQMTVQTDRLGLVKFGWEVIMNTKSLAEEMEEFQKAVSEGKAGRQGVEKKLTQLKVSLSSSDA